MITLFLGIPLLVVSLLLYHRGSLCEHLRLTGMLGSFLYTYGLIAFLTATIPCSSPLSPFSRPAPSPLYSRSHRLTYGTWLLTFRPTCRTVASRCSCSRSGCFSSSYG